MRKLFSLNRDETEHLEENGEDSCLEQIVLSSLYWSIFDPLVKNKAIKCVCHIEP